jgi:hypothetical protein
VVKAEYAKAKGWNRLVAAAAQKSAHVIQKNARNRVADTGGARLRIETKQWRTIARDANPQVLVDRYPRSVTDETWSLRRGVFLRSVAVERKLLPKLGTDRMQSGARSSVGGAMPF